MTIKVKAEILNLLRIIGEAKNNNFKIIICYNFWQHTHIINNQETVLGIFYSQIISGRVNVLL